MFKSKINPGLDHEHALRYLKYVVKQIPLEAGEPISFEIFLDSLQNECCGVNKAFQQIIFYQCGMKMAAAEIKACLAKYRSMCLFDVNEHDIVYDLPTFFKLNSTTKEGVESRYRLVSFVHQFAPQIYSDFYELVTRTTNTKASIIVHIKLLYQRFAAERFWLHRIEKKCHRLFGLKKQLSRVEFHKVIDCERDLAEKLFTKLDVDGSGYLTIDEFKEEVISMLVLNTEGRLHYLFEIYDSDGSGALSRNELRDVLSMCVSENRLDLNEEMTNNLLDIVWFGIHRDSKDSAVTERDETGDECITFEEFYGSLKNYPEIIENLAVDFLNRKKPKFSETIVEKVKVTRNRFSTKFNSNKSLCFLMLIYTLLTIGLIVQRAYKMRELERWLIGAKCAGQMLNLNIMLMLLFTLKRTATRLQRIAWLRQCFPFNDLLFVHKLTAVAVLFFSFIHVGCHIGVIVSRLLYTSRSRDYFYTGANTVNFVSGVTLFSSIVVLIISLVLIRDRWYEIFIRMHQAVALLFVAADLAHSKHGWIWIVAPTLFILLERVYFIISVFRLRSRVKSARVQGNTVHLVIERPVSLKYRPGDYVFINIPQISKHEWHPFTISSSPLTEDGMFQLHIRKVGSWTGKLHSQVNELTKSLSNSGVQNNGFETTELDEIFLIKEPNGNDTPLSKYSVEIVTEDRNDKYLPRSKSAAEINSPYSPSTTVSVQSESENKRPSIPRASLSPKNGHQNFLSERALNADQPPRDFNNEFFFKNNILYGSMKDGKTMSDVERRVNALNLSIDEDPERALQLDYEEYKQKRFKKSMAHSVEPCKVSPNWKVNIDGPYCTPSRDILSSKHAILVAGGIGVTPFTSVLESVVNILRERKKFSGPVRFMMSKFVKTDIDAVQRIDFFWVTRDQKHLSVFNRVFREIEEAQAELGLSPPLVHLHIYLTGLKRVEDVRGTFLQLALEMAYKQDSQCALSGLKAKTLAGRPDWSQVLPEVIQAASQLEHKRIKPKLFACGPVAMCDGLKKECRKQDIAFREEVF